MNDRPDIDERLGELLRSELPVPEHAEGHRELVVALLTAEAVVRASRDRGQPRLAWPWARRAAERPLEVEWVPHRRPRPRRLAVAASLAFLLVIVIAVGTVETLVRLGEPEMVLRITDETIVDPNDPAATRTTIVSTSLASLADTKTLLGDLTAAINEGDPAAIGKFYLTNGWLENSAGNINIQGSQTIAQYWQEAFTRFGLRLEAEGDPIPYDRYIAQPVRYTLPGGVTKTGVCVFQIDTQGLIAHEWILGWVTG